MQLSEKVLAIAPSMTLVIDNKAKSMKAAGQDVVSFGAGEPDFDTPAAIREAAKDAIDHGKTRYTPVSGYLDLRRAICEKILRENGAAYQPEQIVVSNGAKHSLYNAFFALINPGDEVIIPSPCWVSYPEMVKMCGGVPVFISTREESGFCMDLKALEDAITLKTKALVLCNPCNPTGAYHGREYLQAIANMAVEHDFAVIEDAIYEKLLYDGEKHLSITTLGEEIKERTVFINGASKTFAMTGWRVGYSATNSAWAKAISSFQSQATSNACSVSQAAFTQALKAGSDELPAMVREFEARRNLICERINAIPGISCRKPHGAFYVLMNIKSILGKTYKSQRIEDDMAFADMLLENEKVAVVPGKAFMAPGFVRLSYATSREMIEKGMSRIAAFVGDLK